MNFRVGGKLAIGFALVLAFTIAAALVSWTEGRRLVQDAARLYKEGVVVTEALGQAEAQLQRIRGILFEQIASVSDPSSRRAAEDAVEVEAQRFFQALDRADAALAEGSQRRVKIQELRLLFTELQQLRRTKLTPLSVLDDDAAALEVAVDELQPAFQQTLDKLNELIEAQVDASARLHDDVRKALEFTANVSLWTTLVAALVAALVAWWLSRSISNRISALAAVARDFGQGDSSRRAEIDQSDEITDLARAFNKMAADLVETVETQRAIADEQTTETEKMAAQVQLYGEFLERVASGDLAAQVTVEGGAGLSKLGQNLNAMAAGLRSMTLRVHETVGALSSASAEILATSQEHAVSATDSASAVAETVATVEEVSQAAQQMTQTADAVQAKAEKSRQVAGNGMQAVQRTVEAMAQVKKQVSAIADGILSLSEHAQTVGHIITTVNELAEQSNLLALNAAIEATRAGENGRAFGIVAQEIRGLADQSKQATAQVRDILGTIQKATSAAVLTTEDGQKTVAVAESTVADAGKTIELLAETLEQTSDAAEHIRSAANQQAQGVSQISEAMRSIDGAVRQTADSTRHIERAATDLNSLSGKLQHAVAQYRI